jgi:thiamine biosynthesis lipoprotein
VRRRPFQLLLALGLAAGCSASPRGELILEGAAFGTGWTVRVARTQALPAQATLERAVRQVLERVDQQMSTHRDDSELARFNRLRESAWFEVSPETARVSAAARELALRSGGAFDPTVGPLVQLWGFGARQADTLPPGAERLRAARAAVGFDLLAVREAPPALRKAVPELELDLSAIAKGYAADAIAERLLALGAASFLIEVGGELRASGARPRGGPWRVAIEDPLARAQATPALVALRDEAIATSGPYRNFVVRGGQRFSHLLDPRTGAPVSGDLLSVSVIAPSALLADGWATALLVAGAEEGWALAERERLAALFTRRDARRRATAAFATHWVE